MDERKVSAAPVVNQIILTLRVPSIEETAAWYERVLSWEAHFDTFNEAGRCLFGSVMLQESPFVGLNLARSAEDGELQECDHCSIWVYVEDVDAVYGRVVEQEWPVEAELKDTFWGERQFRLRDLNGNQLVITQQIEDLELKEIRQRHQELLSEADGEG